MQVSDTRCLEILESSQIGEARRAITTLAMEAGCDEKLLNRLAIVVQELGTNLVKHPGVGGCLLAQTITGNKSNERIGIDLYSIDSGRGMDVDACLIDGNSSSGTLGHGLGAIKRLSDECHFQSQFQHGTVIHARLWNTAQESQSPFTWGAISVPKLGEVLVGDKWAIDVSEKALYCLVVDGLGHGVEACEASTLAVKRFRENLHLPPAAMIRQLHQALRGSRGAVGAVAKLDREAGTVAFCGLGNIEGIIQSGDESKRLTSLNGTLGYEARRFNEFTLPWQPGATLVMHSDGFTSKTLHSFSGLLDGSPALSAGWLYKDFSRTTDDATVLVVTQPARSQRATN
jgi:anti-sigma regulatory factor (Ser/Thr protein kinase)